MSARGARFSRGALAVAVALGVVALAAPRVARADGPGVLNPQIKLPDAKHKGAAPNIEMTIVSGPKVPLKKFSISTLVKQQKVTLPAIKLRDYDQGHETIAIALVINGQEIWVGNEDWEPDPNSQYTGVLKKLEAAIDKLQLGKAGPPGSKGVVVSYSTGAEIKVPMGPLKAITGAALGTEKDYKGKIGNDMVSGIRMGMAELQKVSTDRKALIVVGDGNDTNNDAAKHELIDLRKQAQQQNVQLFAVIYKSQISQEGTVITTMIPSARTVNSVEGIATELNSIIAQMADRYYVTFEGYNPKTKIGLPWDGKDHDLTVRIDQTDLDPITVTLAPKWSPAHGGGFPWLILILVVVGGLLLLIIGVKVFGGKKAVPMPMPEPVAAPMPMPMPMPAAPKPAGPMKTVMIGAGGDEGGFPIVGWLVPLNGVDAFKTMRLRPGLTKIGTAPPADLVINDGFMSTEHCQIICSPAGFTLQDAGSTNGCYVNDQRVQKQELLDNDVVTLGKTNLKFKSIN